MADNTEACGNCGTENPAGQDFCVKCHRPLTASTDEGIRENLAAQEGGRALRYWRLFGDKRRARCGGHGRWQRAPPERSRRRAFR